jgi:hypothetical protein
VLLEQPPTLAQRLAEAIASSLPCEVLNLYAQLRTAIDKVAPSEIEASAADVTHLLETMRRLRDELQRMKALKQSFEALH